MRTTALHLRVPSLRRAGIAAATIATLLVAAPVALAAPPLHMPARDTEITFGPGEVCADAIHFENTTLRARETDFAPSADGAWRAHITGMGVSRATDLDSGAVYDFQGGLQFTFSFAPDGAMRVAGHGRDFLVWYLPGDNSEIGVGLFQVSGTATEWYAPDGTFIRATFTGHATNLCTTLSR